MRTNIVIDDNLISEAMLLTGIKTKREVVDEALRLLVEQTQKTNAFQGIRALRGQITFWEDVIEEVDANRPGTVYYGKVDERVLHEEKAEYVINTPNQTTGEQSAMMEVTDSTTEDSSHEKQ